MAVPRPDLRLGRYLATRHFAVTPEPTGGRTIEDLMTDARRCAVPARRLRQRSLPAEHLIEHRARRQRRRPEVAVAVVAAEPDELATRGSGRLERPAHV